jgi:hypothetical protein
MIRQPRQHSEKHLAFIRQLPCLCCGDNTSTEAAHIRFSSLQAGKRQVGKGERPDDKWTVPLCGSHHRTQHQDNERAFWANHQVDPIFIALALWGATGNHELGEQIVAANAPSRIAAE